MVIGVESFYEQMLPVTETWYLTVVQQDFEADAFFPEIETEEWEVVVQVKHEADEKHAYPYSFITYRRI